MKNIIKNSNYFYLLASEEKDLYIDFLDDANNFKSYMTKINEKSLMHKFNFDEHKNDLESSVEELQKEIINKEKSNIKPIKLVKIFNEIKHHIAKIFEHGNMESIDENIFSSFVSRIENMIKDYIKNYK